MADHERSIRARQTIRLVIWLVILGALVLFAAINTEEVEVDWVVGDTNMPLWVVIAGTALGGAVIGYLARWRQD